MANSFKIEVPVNGTLSDVIAYYQELYAKVNKTTTGNLRFPTAGNSTGGFVYNTTGTSYNNQGEMGMLNLILYGDSLDPLYVNPRLINYLVSSEDANFLISHILGSGTSAERPTTIGEIGGMFFDTTLGKPIWIKTTDPLVWVDATGATV